MQLAPRECEVLLLLADGSTFKWIGYRLGITPNAARMAAKSAYRKMGVHCRREAIERHKKHRAHPSRYCYRVATL